jgi:hypothetical protein
LPVQFGHVKDDFRISGTQITSLKGSPQSIGGNFYCFSTSISSLEYAPRRIGGSIHCHGTLITSLSGVDKMIKYVNDCFLCNVSTHMLGLVLIKGMRRVSIADDNPSDALYQIMNRYVGTGDILSAQDELIDAGLIDQARL